MRNVLILPHQGHYMQAPALFPEVRFFFLCCGYGAGKTRADVIAALHDVKRLQHKKDRAGDYARLLVCGYTLSHLEKTFLIYFRQYLDMSKTAYTESKKYNMFTIGTVTVILQPLENPGDIFGLDVHKCVSSRSRVVIRRAGRVLSVPIAKVRVGDEAFTRAGWKKVLAVTPTGLKPVMEVNGLSLTPDHEVYSDGTFREARTLARGIGLAETSVSRVKAWQALVEGAGRLSRIVKGVVEEPGELRPALRGVIAGLALLFRLVTGNAAGRNRNEWFRVVETAVRLMVHWAIAPFPEKRFWDIRAALCNVSGFLDDFAGALPPKRAVKEGYVRRIKRREGRLREVYDLTVEGSHEFFADGILVHNCYVEEADELTTDKMLEATKALNERCRQVIPGERSPCVCFASTSQGQKGLYALHSHFKKTGVGFLLIRGRTEDNPFLPPELVRDMIKTYTPEEREVFMHGKFLAIAKGRVIPGFDWDRNFVGYDLDRNLDPGETVYWAQDVNSGYNRGSAYVVRGGILYCVKYYDFHDLMDAAKVVRYDFPEQRILWLPDVTIKDAYPSLARELRRYDIKIIHRKKSPLVEDSCFLVSKLFHLGRLIVCKIARNVAEACAMAMRDNDNRIPKGKGASSPIHALDGVRYVCTFVAATHEDFRDIKELILNKRASMRDEAGREKRIKHLKEGYLEINPEAFIR